MMDNFAQYKSIEQKAAKSLRKIMDLPSYSPLTQQYFTHAFNTFSKLWILQQRYRTELELHSFTRNDVGELASRIAQLYTQYYLHSSDVSSLREAFVFYQAVRNRKYFTAFEEHPSGLNHFMRYLARYVLVCFLLGKDKKLIKSLFSELCVYAEKMKNCDVPERDRQQWDTLLKELELFLSEYSPLNISENLPQEFLTPRIKLSETFESRRKISPSLVTLNASLVVSNRRNQIKYSEIPLDTLRMIHSLEFDPSYQAENAEKCLEYRPSLDQILTDLSHLFSTAHSNKAVLVYFNSNVVETKNASSPTEYGISLENGVLVPSDFTPFLNRDSKPIMIITELDKPELFKFPTNTTSKMWVHLSGLPAEAKYCNLSLWFQNPIEAICSICKVTEKTAEEIVQANVHLNEFYSAAFEAFSESKEIPFLPFLTDIVLARMIFHFLLAFICLSSLKENTEKFLPLLICSTFDSSKESEKRKEFDKIVELLKTPTANIYKSLNVSECFSC